MLEAIFRNFWRTFICGFHEILVFGECLKRYAIYGNELKSDNRHNGRFYAGTSFSEAVVPWNSQVLWCRPRAWWRWQTSRTPCFRSSFPTETSRLAQSRPPSWKSALPRFPAPAWLWATPLAPNLTPHGQMEPPPVYKTDISLSFFTRTVTKENNCICLAQRELLKLLYRIFPNCKPTNENRENVRTKECELGFWKVQRSRRQEQKLTNQYNSEIYHPNTWKWFNSNIESTCIRKLPLQFPQDRNITLKSSHLQSQKIVILRVFNFYTLRKEIINA